MKRTLSLILAVLMCCSLSAQAVATDFIYDGEEYVYYDDYMTFQSEDDVHEAISGGSIHQPPAETNYVAGQLIYHETSGGQGLYNYYAYFESRGFLSKQFIRYLSSSWAKTDGYTWTQTNTASMSFSGSASLSFAQKVALQAGLSLSRSTSYSLGTHIPADASKYSKLGFASDMIRLMYRYKVYNAAGVCTTSTIDTITSPTVDSYLIVYYQ